MARRKDPLGRKRAPRVRKLTRQEQIVHDLRERANIGQLDGPRWGFTASKLGKTDTCVFRACFAARAFFDAIVDGYEWDWVDSSMPARGVIEVENGVTITGDKKTLESILRYKMKPLEAEYWELPERERNRVLYICSEIEYVPPAEPTYRKRHSRKGMIKANAVAEQLGMKPREFRSKLRRAGIEKPEHGWAWRTQQEVDALLHQLSGTIRVDFTNVQEPS